MAKVDKKFLKKILETPSVTGTEVGVAERVRKRLANVADSIETNVMGSVHATLKGKGNAPSVMIAAHMDEVGLMVTYISEEGFLSVLRWAALMLRYCRACVSMSTRNKVRCAAWSEESRSILSALMSERMSPRSMIL